MRFRSTALTFILSFFFGIHLPSLMKWRQGLLVAYNNHEIGGSLENPVSGIGIRVRFFPSAL